MHDKHALRCVCTYVSTTILVDHCFSCKEKQFWLIFFVLVLYLESGGALWNGAFVQGGVDKNWEIQFKVQCDQLIVVWLINPRMARQTPTN